ncbi:MAG: YggS family pyridoxal phosphate-dependent enzyme [Gammaproteobacteria bacterium]|nr:YggS family pyridoxal phosphate-dependent enzyme [Gammaproteobacteria bacterium]MYB37081.1 YggS family pyridoxal phosphate-dependent enzyme [Gammaproteobacteria bacterium]
MTLDVASAAQVEAAIRAAEARAGRPSGVVRLLAVSKTRAAAEVASLRAAGIEDFGENYLQEALPKIRELAGQGITWHFIGAIQSNKTRDIARHFHWVHTVDRARVADRLNAAAHRTLDVCLQVNVDAEPQKAGVAPEETGELLARVKELDNLRPRGLMAIPKEGDGEATRESFRRLRRLFDDLAPIAGTSWDTLSMGMSGDFEVAVAEGSTLVRIGTALFGPRPPRTDR